MGSAVPTSLRKASSAPASGPASSSRTCQVNPPENPHQGGTIVFLLLLAPGPGPFPGVPKVGPGIAQLCWNFCATLEVCIPLEPWKGPVPMARDTSTPPAAPSSAQPGLEHFRDPGAATVSPPHPPRQEFPPPAGSFPLPAHHCSETHRTQEPAQPSPAPPATDHPPIPSELLAAFWAVRSWVQPLCLGTV